MRKRFGACTLILFLSSILCTFAHIGYPQTASRIGRELAIPVRMEDGQEYQVSLSKLLSYGEKLFSAKWTSQEGEGRPMAKGTANGARLSNPDNPLVFPRNCNRTSGPDSNSCRVPQVSLLRPGTPPISASVHFLAKTHFLSPAALCRIRTPRMSSPSSPPPPLSY